jgi:sugar lactone lactonase YvrE
MRRILALALPMALAFAVAGCSDDETAPCEEAPGTACTWAGTTALGLNGDGKDRRETILYWPVDIDFAPDGTPWVLDWNNHMVRRVRADQTFETVVGTFVGDGPPDQSDLMAPGAPGLDVALNHPTDLAFRPDGTVIFAAWHNHKIRQVDPATGLVQVVFGRGVGFAGDGGEAAADVRLNQPKAILLDDAGALYVLDQRNFRVRRFGEDGFVTEVGTGMAGFSGDGGPAVDAQVAFEAGGNPEPSGALARAADGTLFIADALNQRIRVVHPDGVIETIAGTGTAGYSGDGGPAVAAQVNNVKDLELGPDGRLYLADTDNHVVRAIDLGTGVIETVAGSGAAGAEADGLPAREAQLNRPFGIAFDAAGALYIADTFNSRIVKIPR